MTDRLPYDPERVIDRLSAQLATALATIARLEAVLEKRNTDADDEESTPL